MLIRIPCEVSDGLRPQEASVKLTDYHGKPEFLPIHRDMLDEENGRHYLSVALVHADTKRNAVLVGLPIEADSGAHRIWVKMDQALDIPSEILA